MVGIVLGAGNRGLWPPVVQLQPNRVSMHFMMLAKWGSAA